MASYHRSTKIAAAPVGAGFVIASSYFGQKTSTCSISRFSSAATKSLRHRTAYSTYVRSNQAFPRPTSLSKCQYRQKSTCATVKLEPSSPKTVAAPTGSNLMQWYESHLQSNPVRTKMATGSFLWGLGDFVAQVVPTILPNGKTGPTTDHTNDTATTNTTNTFTYDYPRTARAVLFGFAIHAPLSHVHFNLLESMTIRGGFSGLTIPIFKTTMEQVNT